MAVLGRGASGVVASAFDSWTGQVVAIKKVADAFDEAHWARRLLREILLLDFLCHPNLMRLRALPLPLPSSAPPASATNWRSADSGGNRSEHGGGNNGTGGSYYFRSVYLVTDRMDTDLHLVLRTQRLSPDHLRFFLYQLLCGLHYLHSAGIVHRDVKPANILLNADCRLRLADFGLSRGLPRRTTTAATGETAAAAAAGSGDGDGDGDGDGGEAGEAEAEAEAVAMTEYVVTRHYRAPEIMLTSRAYGTAVDMWAVGCVLAEMLHPGEALFPGRSYLHMLRMMAAFLGSAHPLPRGMSQRAAQFMASLPHSDGVRLSDHFLDASPLALDLLSKLLVMDPAQRLTAAQALRHPHFASLFREEHLTPSPTRFHSPYDAPGVAAALGTEDVRRIIFRLAMRKQHTATTAAAATATTTTATTTAASSPPSSPSPLPPSRSSSEEENDVPAAPRS